VTQRHIGLLVVAVLAVSAAAMFAYVASRDAGGGAGGAAVAAPGGASANGSDTSLPSPPVAAAIGRWLPGDMHSHISPPDAPPDYGHAASNLDQAIAAARKAGLAWLVITPHSMDRKNEQSGRLWAEEMADRLAKRPAGEGDPLVVLGWERTYQWPGDMTVSFVDLPKAFNQPIGKTMAEIRRQGGLAIAAHPFFLPGLFGDGDKSWKPWTDKTSRGADLDAYLSGLEIRHPASPAASAARKWDDWIGRQQRRVLGVGATDDHWGRLYATTWVYVEGDLTREKLHAALASGRIVVGESASAGSLTVTSDRKGADGRAEVGRIGDAIVADRRITIAWTGKGKLFIDGRQLRNETGPVAFDIEPGTFHWVRLEAGIASYSNPVYVNLPESTALPPLAPAPAANESRDAKDESERPKYGPSAK
jgi:hypothetical protein